MTPRNLRTVATRVIAAIGLAIALSGCIVEPLYPHYHPHPYYRPYY